MATTTEMGKGPRGSRTSCPTRGSILAAPARWLCAGAWLIVVAISTVGATTTAAASAASAASDGVYRVRSLVATAADGLRALSSDNRRLYEFIPTFSEDGVITELPYLLSLQLRGIGNATAMSSGAYDAIQNAMSEYLRDVLGERWGDSDDDTGDGAGDGAGPVLTGVTTEIVAERALNNTNTNTSGGAGTRGRRTLQDGGAAGGGVEVDLKATLTFRGAEATEAAADGTAIVDGTEDPSSSSSSSSSVPPQEDLAAAAGDVWNDLSTFETVYLADVLADEDASVQQEFAALESIGSAEVFPTSPPAVAPVTTTAAPVEVAPTTAPATPPPPAPSSSSSPPPQPTGNIVAGINDSDTPPAQPQTGLNPLWPALIVGVAVFLCTILVLGYRRQQVRDGLIGNKADSTIHVHDNLTYDGEEEIEVEDHYLTGGAAAAEAAAAAASSGAARSAPRTADSYDASVEDEEGGWRHASSSRCGRSSGRCRAINSERYRDGSVSRISASLHTDSAEEYDLYATMDAAEKHNFLRWMQSGVSIEEASERVLRERQRHSTTGRMSAPARQQLHSEIMEDGRTMVHIPQHLLADSAAGGGGGDNAQARKYAMMSSMVMSEASSVASSFDDREYLRVGGSALNSSGDSGQRSLGSRQTRASSDGLGGTTRGGAILGRHESEI